MITQDVDAALRQFQSAAGFPGLDIATGTNGMPDHDERRFAIEVDVGPGERPELLGPGTGKKRQDDVGVKARVLRGGKQRLGLGQGQRLGRPPSAALQDLTQQDDVPLDLIPGLSACDGTFQDGPDLLQRPGAQDLSLSSRPPIYVVSRYVAELARTQRGDDVRVRQDGALLDGVTVPAAQAEGKPVTHGTRD